MKPVTLVVNRNNEGRLVARISHDDCSTICLGPEVASSPPELDDEQLDQVEWQAFMTFCVHTIVQRLRVKAGKPVSKYATDEHGKCTYVGKVVIQDGKEVPA